MALELQSPRLREERRTPNVPQMCSKHTLSAPTDEPRASCGLPTQSRPIRRSSDEARSARRGKVRAVFGKVRRDSAQSELRDRPRSHGRWRRGEAEPGRRGAGSGRGPTKRKGGKRDPAEARQRAQASSAVSPRKSRKPATPQARKSRKPATPQALKPQVPQPRKSRNPPQVPQDQQPHKPPQSRNPLNPRSSRKSCKPLAKSFCAF
mgnify:FL=1